MDETYTKIDLGLRDLAIGKRIYHYKKIKSNFFSYPTKNQKKGLDLINENFFFCS